MRILFVTPSPPHPTEGGAAIRNYHLIEAAKDAGHAVDVLAVARDRTPISPFSPDGFDIAFVTRASDPSRVDRLRTLAISPQPDLAHRLRDPEFLREAGQKLRDAVRHGRPYDAVQVEGLEMWGNVPHPRNLGNLRNRVPLQTIYDAHNAETTLQRRTALVAARTGDAAGAAYSAVQWAKLRAYERNAVRAATATLALSPEDARALSRLAHKAVDVVPVGVDTAHYDRDAPDLPAPIPFDAVFSGTLDYRANADAARWLVTEVWPFVRRIRPDATLAIVGKNPSAALRAHHGRNGVTITGAVPDDRPYMAGAGVYVLPIRFGAGMRLKLLNAMSMSCPVVATPVAVEGVEAMHGRDLLIAPPRVDSFAAGIIMLLRNAEARPRFGEAARRLMTERHDWRHVAPALLRVYDRLERDRHDRH